MAQVVDHVGDVEVQLVLPLLDRQTDRQTYGQMEAWGHRKAVLSTPAMAALRVLARRAEGSSLRLPAFGLLLGGSWYERLWSGLPTCHFGAGLDIVDSETCQRCG